MPPSSWSLSQHLWVEFTAPDLVLSVFSHPSHFISICAPSPVALLYRVRSPSEAKSLEILFLCSWCPAQNSKLLQLNFTPQHEVKAMLVDIWARTVTPVAKFSQHWSVCSTQWGREGNAVKTTLRQQNKEEGHGTGGNPKRFSFSSVSLILLLQTKGQMLNLGG